MHSIVRSPGFARLLLPILLAAFAPSVRASDKVEYNRDIRPILAENCFACHGPDSASRKAKLRLDQREAAVKAGVIAPGKPDDSELVRRIIAEDPKEMMPPAKYAQEADAGPERSAQDDGLPQGPNISRTGPISSPSGPPLPGGQRTGWVAQSDRPICPGEAGRARA